MTEHSQSQLLSTDEAFWHCMSLVLGLGTLTMPYVFKQLGWFGVIVLALLAWLSGHTAKILCKCIDFDHSKKSEEMPVHASKSKEMKTYPDLGEAAFGKEGRMFVNFILYTDLVASSALFLVFIATNLEELFVGWGDLNPSTSSWILISTISLFPTVHLKLNKLSSLSKFGSYIMIFLVIGVLYAAITAEDADLERNEYHVFKFELSAIGNMVFAFSCHGTLLTIYKQMAKPEDVDDLFDKVYASGYFLKLVVGTTGYFIFAQNVSDQISLNFQNQILKIVVTALVTLKKWATYALPLEPVAVDFHDMAMARNRKRNEKKVNFMIRSFLVGLTGILAFFLPYFGLFQSLVGSLCAGFLVLVFPIGFYIKLYGKNLRKKDLMVEYILLGISIVLVIVSTYCSVSDAYVKWSEVSEETVL